MNGYLNKNLVNINKFFVGIESFSKQIVSDIITNANDIKLLIENFDLQDILKDTIKKLKHDLDKFVNKTTNDGLNRSNNLSIWKFLN